MHFCEEKYVYIDTTFTDIKGSINNNPALLVQMMVWNWTDRGINAALQYLQSDNGDTAVLH